jgi:hypothetical protein
VLLLSVLLLSVLLNVLVAGTLHRLIWSHWGRTCESSYSPTRGWVGELWIRLSGKGRRRLRHFRASLLGSTVT